MPNNVVIAEGKTTNEAIENGLKKLKAKKNMESTRKKKMLYFIDYNWCFSCYTSSNFNCNF